MQTADRKATGDGSPLTRAAQTAKRVIAVVAALIFGLVFAASTARAQLVIVGVHTIEVDEGEIVALTQSISGDATSVLNIVGAGRVDLSAASVNFQGTVYIRGAEFRFHGAGRMNGPNNAFIVENGGTFTLDGTALSGEIDHLSDTSDVTLSAGTLRLLLGTYQGSSGENFGVLSLTGGANTISIQKNANTTANHFQTTNLVHSGTATVNLTGNTPYGLNTSDNIRIRVTSALPTNFAFNGILPWASVEGADWVSPFAQGNTYWLVPLATYHDGPPSTWAASSNVFVTGNAISLGATHTINSLKLEGTSVGLNNITLTLVAGGLLTTGGNSTITGAGTIRTLANRPLYAHVYSNRLILENGARFTGNLDLVKTGPGTLELNSEGTHQLRTITLNEGEIRLSKGLISVRGDIVVGDGAGRDLFELAAQSNNRIVRPGLALPTMTLHGNPYGPASDEAILRFGNGGNVRQALATLHIRDCGTLDFGSGGNLLPNILYLNQLTFNNTDAQLTIRNWVERADYLLVRRNWGNANVPPILPQIHFEGYGPARWEPHDLNGFDDYWQITPFPEPTTYGALLAAVGLGLWAWKKRKRSAATNA